MAGALTRLDTKLLEMAANGLSPDEMEREVGVPAAQALLHVKRILGSRDVWTEVERRQLLLQDLYALKAQIQSQNLNYFDEKQGGLLVKTLTTIGNILDKQSAMTDEEINRITEANARAMLRMISAAFERAKEYLRVEYPDVDIFQIEAAFNAGLNQEVTQVVTD
jgi:hypothetical protein